MDKLLTSALMYLGKGEQKQYLVLIAKKDIEVLYNE